MTEIAKTEFSKLPWHELEFMEERFLRDGGSRLNFAQSREQNLEGLPTIVFCHGVLRDWKSFYPLLVGLRGKANLVSIDFRGHGQSESTSGAYQVVNYVDDAVRLINSLERQVYLYGHSLGAMVALAAAARIPERIKTAILEDPPFSTMGARLPGTPLMHYFQSVEAVVHSEVETGARLQSKDTDAKLEKLTERIFEAFSEIAVGTDADGKVIRIRDQRDVISRRFSAETLARIDPDVLASITSGNWLDGYDLNSLLDSVICKVILLRADTACGGMLTSEEADHIVRQLDGHGEQIYFSGVGHSMHWAKPLEIEKVILNQISV